MLVTYNITLSLITKTNQGLDAFNANTNQRKYIKCRNELVCILSVHRSLGVKPIENLTRYEWIAFLLFNILDYLCTTCFVFANSFGKSFQSRFANSQRYINKIARSIFKI
jgi:hypothetical protein